jgi:excisionase family DNA binding protein
MRATFESAEHGTLAQMANSNSTLTRSGGAESPINNRLLSRREAAAYLGISIRFLCDLLSQRSVACIRIGGRTMLDRSDLDAFIESNKVKAAGWKGGVR